MSITTARKQAICGHCGKYIEIGERHISETFKKNDRYIAEKLHFDCEQEYNASVNNKRYAQFSESISDNPQFYTRR